MTVKSIYPETVKLNEQQQKAFKSYEDVKGNKAFLASENGAYATFSSDVANSGLLRYTFSECQKKASAPCQIIGLNGTDYLKEYAKFSNASANAISRMKIRSEQYRLVEQQDWLMPEPDGPRIIDEGVHFATPTQVKAAKTIDTASLVELIKAEKIVLIHATMLADSDSETIPNAHVFDSAGIVYGQQSNKHQLDDSSIKNLEIIMRKIAPEKNQAIAVFCASPECWMSLNTIMRLHDLGYTNLHWYRGGLTAWMVAQLPTVKAVPFATVWAKQ
ncbi:hypothetical protein H8K35_04080 [Undibacterium sp. LX40W]|uniref:Rhodanese domain-containing protein n=1 Tax=Undibacterium nitidum TaxID=2762298 RepID=A0A923HSQ3_9BURK|nr:rhodanese-like domain-containing protein [Undibacterium nitidum]MBC3880434.1 hypothetical protein [Undibacterium nitidum]MBC3890830.1 hypothetical protein [Undibacterium sp. LX40W]